VTGSYLLLFKESKGLNDRALKKKLKVILGFKPRRLAVYKKALVHKSICYTRDKQFLLAENNERLEYLGDSILNSIIAEYLYANYKNRDEGFLTKMRSRIVKRKNMDNLGKTIGLHRLVLYRPTTSNHRHIFGNALEALIGAIFIDKGYKRTRKFVLKQLVDKHLNIPEIIQQDHDFKSKLIEWCQKKKFDISFETHDSHSDLNRNLYFNSHVIIDNIEYGTGIARSKKEAEQRAAQYTWEYKLSTIKKDHEQDQENKT
jgi:ribonuclease-3